MKMVVRDLAKSGAHPSTVYYYGSFKGLPRVGGSGGAVLNSYLLFVTVLNYTVVLLGGIDGADTRSTRGMSDQRLPSFPKKAPLIFLKDSLVIPRRRVWSSFGKIPDQNFHSSGSKPI